MDTNINSTNLHPIIRDALDVDEAASYLGVTAQTMFRWRAANKGPEHFRIGLRIRYRIEDLDAWIQFKVQSTGLKPIITNGMTKAEAIKAMQESAMA